MVVVDPMLLLVTLTNSFSLFITHCVGLSHILLSCSLSLNPRSWRSGCLTINITSPAEVQQPTAIGI